MRLFPRTPHLFWSGFRGRDDLQLSAEESESFLRGVVVVQEKLDGSNISFRVEDDLVVVENRGKPVSSHPQFDLLKRWAAEHDGALRGLGSFSLFGEWLVAEHGTPYDRLPDWFVAYDLYDPERDQFLPWKEVEETCAALGLGPGPHPSLDAEGWSRGPAPAGWRALGVLVCRLSGGRVLPARRRASGVGSGEARAAGIRAALG